MTSVIDNGLEICEVLGGHICHEFCITCIMQARFSPTVTWAESDATVRVDIDV